MFIVIEGVAEVRFRQYLEVPADEADEIIADREIQITNLDLDAADKDVIDFDRIQARKVKR